MEQEIEFKSNGLQLSGVVHVPGDIRPGERRPAFVVLHGFGSNKEAGNTVMPARMLKSGVSLVLACEFTKTFYNVLSILSFQHLQDKVKDTDAEVPQLTS